MLSTFFSVGIGVLLAWSLAHQSNFKGRSVVIAILSSSLALPTLIVVFGLISVFGRHGWINLLSFYLFGNDFGAYLYGLFGILVAHVYLNASFASSSLLHSFESIPKEKYKLSKSLNFTVIQRFRYIEFPAIKGNLAGISSIIFLLCFSSFSIVLILGGSPSYNTLEVAIYEAVKLDFDLDRALKLSFVQLSITLLLVVFFSTFKTNLSNLKISSLNIPWPEPRIVKYTQVIVIILFLLFFITPIIAIVLDGINADFKNILHQEIFLQSFLTSISLASVSSLSTVFIALLLSYLQRNFSLETRLGKYRFSKFFSIILTLLGYFYLAIPSLVVGLGFFLLSQQVDLPIKIWSMIAVFTTNVLMSLPFALSVLMPAIQKIAQRYDKLIISLNISKIQRLLYCELPYLRSALGYVLALSFCFSLGDLGVIALFSSDDFTTLPWYLYQLMGSYKTRDARGVALILLVIILLAFIGLPKIFREKNVKSNKSNFPI